MNCKFKVVAAIAAVSAVVLGGCSGEGGAGGQGFGGGTATRGEHDRDGGEHSGAGEHGPEGHSHHGADGEESGKELPLKEVYDQIRSGARLILAYDEQTRSFDGTVENTTDKTLESVRVEVHLSNGKELGPTTPADLKPGEKRDVKLRASKQGFNAWTAHPELGSGEHGHAGQRGEHGA